MNKESKYKKDTHVDCVFCKIVKQEVPCYKIYEDEYVLAFLDIFPANEGHTLIIPKKHRINIFDIKQEELKRISIVAKKIALKMKNNLGIQNCNIIQSSGKQAGQEVFHFHMHIVPRLENDGLNIWSGKIIKKPNFELIVEKLKL